MSMWWGCPSVYGMHEEDDTHKGAKEVYFRASAAKSGLLSRYRLSGCMVKTSTDEGPGAAQMTAIDDGSTLRTAKVGRCIMEKVTGRNSNWSKHNWQQTSKPNCIGGSSPLVRALLWLSH